MKGNLGYDHEASEVERYQSGDGYVEVTWERVPSRVRRLWF